MIIFIVIFLLGCVSAYWYLRGKIGVAGFSAYLFCVMVFPAQVKIFSFSPSTIFVYFLFVYSLYYGYKKKLFTEEDNQKILYVILLYLCVFLFLLPLGYDMTLVEQVPTLKLFVLGVFPYIFALYILNRSDFIENILKYIVIVSLFVFAYGVFSYKTNQNIYLMLVGIVYSSVGGLDKMLEESRGGLEGRLAGTIGNPIFYAGMLLILFFLFLALYIKLPQKKKLWRGIILISLLGLFMNMFFTGSRSSLVALILGFGAFCLKWWSKARLAFTFSAILTLFVVGLSFPVFGKYQVFVDSIIFFWDDSKSQGEIKGSSVAMRMYQLDGVASLIGPEGTFFGLGAGWIQKYISKNGLHPVLLGFESLFFGGVVQYGIVGFFLLYILLFIAMLHLCWYFYKQSKISSLEFWFMACYIGSYVVYAFMTGPFFWEFFLCSYVMLLKYFLCKKRERSELLKFLRLMLKEKNNQDA